MRMLENEGFLRYHDYTMQFSELIGAILHSKILSIPSLLLFE